jgi:hypothetical protein
MNESGPDLGDEIREVLEGTVIAHWFGAPLGDEPTPEVPHMFWNPLRRVGIPYGVPCCICERPVPAGDSGLVSPAVGDDGVRDEDAYHWSCLDERAEKLCEKFQLDVPRTPAGRVRHSPAEPYNDALRALDVAEQRFVALKNAVWKARAAGVSWGDIAAVLGVGVLDAREKYGETN